jgi:hypothetical protein
MTRRYIFATYNDIVGIKADLLDKVCERLYILINEDVESIPFHLVKSFQKLKKGLRWVTIQSDDLEEKKLALSFLLGKLHEKKAKDIEFAILSDESEFDGLISFINKARRNCLRVTLTSELEEQFSNNAAPNGQSFVQMLDSEKEKPKVTVHFEDEPVMQLQELPEQTDLTLLGAAKKVRDRMMRSGNRPSEIELLKEYILLNNPNMQVSNAEIVIGFLKENQDIEISNKEVLYHF